VIEAAVKQVDVLELNEEDALWCLLSPHLPSLVLSTAVIMAASIVVIETML